MKGHGNHTNLRHADVPPHLRQWLFDSTSMTRRLTRHCQGSPEVFLLGQRWCVPTREERAHLALRPRERALVREVVLSCRGTPLLFGRSVFPRSSIRRVRWRIGHLGNAPLGRVLFSTRGMQRISASVRPVMPDNLLYRRALTALACVPLPAWQRHSIFNHHQHSLLVCELFLDAPFRADSLS